jgi:hypothetical protein
MTVERETEAEREALRAFLQGGPGAVSRRRGHGEGAA